MAKIVIAEYLTLDGVTEDPGPAGDFEHRGWSVPYWNDELGDDQSELLFASDALLLGRTTYEEFVASWPLRSGDPFTDRINSMPKFVASTTLAEPLEWNATLLKGDVADEVRKLKEAGLRQRGARQDADAVQPDRRVPGDALPACACER
jgi:dihydrofolate reductase